MEQKNSTNRKRLLIGISIGVVLFILTAGAYAMAMLMVSILVMGCTRSPPEWIYLLVFVGYPIPLIISSIVIPYLYIKRQKPIWIILTTAAGIFLSILIFLIWFFILTCYC